MSATRPLDEAMYVLRANRSGPTSLWSQPAVQLTVRRVQGAIRAQVAMALMTLVQ